MSLFKEWKDLIEGQTEKSYPEFWEEYSAAEIKIYSDLLANKDTVVSGSFEELREKYDVRDVMFMGFLDGVKSSLKKDEFDLESITPESKIKLEIDFEKLFYNMLEADADHLFSLDEWNDVLPEDDRRRIYKDYKRSKIVHVEKKPGRNDPCPCGSGKKYKKCCGKNA